MGRRAFLPPALCGACHERPALGDTLFPTGAAWVCPACLTEQSPGGNVTSKQAQKSLQYEEQKSLSKRARAAGEVEDAVQHDRKAGWHGHASVSIKDHGARQALSAQIMHGEALPTTESWLKDTLSDPDLPALDSSYMRGQMLEANHVTALGIDVSNTIGADNTVEKLLSHQLALAHKIAFEQAHKAQRERDPVIELRRLQVSARMMSTAQEAAVTLQKLKTSGPQSVVVQHVHVESGGQAVVGNVQSGERR
jgi:hypothetical protein